MENTLVVRAGNILRPPLLVTSEAMAVEIYDSSMELVAVLHRVLSGNYWAVTTKKDADWDECLSQLGYISRRADAAVGSGKEFFNG